MGLYEEVVDAVRDANGFQPSDPAFHDHLRSLVPALHQLRQGYRTGGGRVQVDYSRPVTEAYLLAYFPHYVETAAAALSFLPADAIADVEPLRVSAFASGPAPEVIAVAQALRSAGYSTTTLRLALPDLSPEHWRWARAVSLERILPIYWAGNVEVPREDQVDITDPDFVSSVRDLVGRSDLIIFQNCLNELQPHDAEHLANELYSTLKPGAALVMADLANYPIAPAVLAAFESVATQRGLRVLRSPADSFRVAAARPPRLLGDHFFLDGEWPRRNPFVCRSLAVLV